MAKRRDPLLNVVFLVTIQSSVFINYVIDQLLNIVVLEGQEMCLTQHYLQGIASCYYLHPSFVYP